MLRISRESTMDARVTVRLEGEIKGRWVEELRRECDRALTDAGRGVQLEVDLAGVSSIDAAGVTLFRELGAGSLVLKNCSPYLEELLKDVGRRPTAGS